MIDRILNALFGPSRAAVDAAYPAQMQQARAAMPHLMPPAERERHKAVAASGRGEAAVAARRALRADTHAGLRLAGGAR